MKLLLFLVNDEGECEYGDDQMSDLNLLVCEDAGKAVWNSCFGVAFHMMKKILVIYGRQRLQLRRRLLKKSWINLIQNESQIFKQNERLQQK